MASDGGFSTKPMGFDKNEVNEYIANLRNKLKEKEAEMKVNDEKTRAAVKTAEEADNKIKAAQEASAGRIAELEQQLKDERKKTEQMEIQIDELKRKTKQSAGADKQAAEMIENANTTAQDIVEKAKQTAHEIISGANGAAAASGGVPEEFMQELRSFMETVSSGFKALNDKAAELGGASVSVAMPDFSSYTAPKAEVPKAAPAAPKPAPKPAPKADESIHMDSAFPFADMGDDDSDMEGFGGDIQPLDPTIPKHEVIEGFDLSGINQTAGEGDVSEIAPLDEDGTGAEMTDDFAASLIAQTVPSSSLGDLDGDLLAAVEQENAKHAVQPSDSMDDLEMGSMGMGGMSMDMDMGSGMGGMDMDMSSDGGINAMNDLLASMGAALENAGGSADSDMSMDMGEPEPSGGAANPWADLQAQLNAMDQSGDFGGDSADSHESAAPEERKVPDADDSGVWDFGSGDSGSDSMDDDMSSDLFGSF